MALFTFAYVIYQSERPTTVIGAVYNGYSRESGRTLLQWREKSVACIPIKWGTKLGNFANVHANCVKLVGGAPAWATMDPGRTFDACPQDPRSLNFLPFGDIWRWTVSPFAVHSTGALNVRQR
jgi:hypothetical protein